MPSTGIAFSINANEMEKIEKIWLTADAVWIRTENGQVACEYFADYPRLRFAAPEQLKNYHTDAFGIQWPDLDEDLNFESFFIQKNHTELYKIFTAHPELNASAIARRMGISQSLLAQYISGIKTPSKDRLEEIYATLHQIGKELLDLHSVA